MSNIRASILLTALVLAPGGGLPVFGQERPDEAEASKAAAAAAKDDNDFLQADVVVDGKTLFSVRGVQAHPAERRTGEIENRIKAVAGNSKIGANSLTLEDHLEGTWIMAGGQRILVVYALGATLVLLVTWRFGRRIVALLRAGFERRYRARIEGFEATAHHIIRVEQIWRVLTGLLNFTCGLTIAVAVYVYLHYVLSLFPWTQTFANSLYRIAVDPLRTMGSGLVGIIPNVVFLGILVVVTRYAMKLIGSLFDSVAAGTMTWKGFDPEWALPTYRLVRLLVIAFAVVVAYPYIPGSESGAFKGVSLLIGLIFSLGSSSLIGNLIAGYSMTYRRAFRVGELVKIGEHIGNVEQIRLLRRDPSPLVLQMELRDFCVTYEINVFCNKPHSMSAFKTVLHRNILDVFNEYGIQVMVPAYEGDPDQPKIAPKERWYAAPARDDVSNGLSVERARA